MQHFKLHCITCKCCLGDVDKANNEYKPPSKTRHP